MAAIKTTVAAEVKVEGLDKAGQSVGSFRKQLKEAQQDVINMSNSFGLTSKEAAAAAKKVAELKDRIGDAKQLADTFNPDKKFVALGGALQGVTAGFSAFTGALGLFGDKGKEVEEVLLKVQSAMALQQGLSGLKSAIDSFKLLGQAIKASTVFQKLNNAATVAATVIQRAFGASVVGTGAAFNVLKAAIIATGIGALVVVLATIVSKMDMFAAKTKTAAEELDELAAATDRVNKAVSEQIEILDRDSELILKRAKIAGASESEISKLQEDAIQKRIDLRNKEINSGINSGIALSELYKQNLKDTIAIQDLQLDTQLKFANAKRDQDKKDADKAAADNEKKKEELKKLLTNLEELRKSSRAKELESIEAYGQQLADIDNAQAEAERQRLIDNQQLEFETKAELAELALLDDPDSIDNKIAKINADFELEMLNFDGNEIRRQVLKKQHEDQITAIETDAIATRQALQQNARMNEINAYQAALGAVADLIGRQTAAGKALAIAEATINVFKAGLQVFSQPMPGIPPVSLGIKIASMVAAIATGIVTVKKIVSTKVPGGGGGGSAPSIPAIPAPIIPRPQTTSLDQQSINAVGNAASRSYVLETDVTNNQERIRRLNRQARIN